MSGTFYRLEIPGGYLYAPITASGTVVTGVIGKRIVLVSAFFTVGANTTAQWQTSSGPNLSGASPIVQYGGFVMNHNAGGWLETLFSDSLVLVISPSTSVGGCLSYSLDGP